MPVVFVDRDIAGKSPLACFEHSSAMTDIADGAMAAAVSDTCFLLGRRSARVVTRVCARGSAGCAINLGRRAVGWPPARLMLDRRAC